MLIPVGLVEIVPLGAFILAWTTWTVLSAKDMQDQEWLHAGFRKAEYAVSLDYGIPTPD